MRHASQVLALILIEVGNQTHLGTRSNGLLHFKKKGFLADKNVKCNQIEALEDSSVSSY